MFTFVVYCTPNIRCKIGIHFVVELEHNKNLFWTMRSRDHEVVVVRRTINLGTVNLEWGRNGEGLRKGRSVYE